MKLSGATNCTAIAPSAPAMPVYRALTPKVSDLYSAVLMPIAAAAIGWSRIATSARPTRPRSRFQPSTNSTTGDRQREEVEPLVRRLSGRPNGRVGLDEDDALHAAGPVLEVLVLQQLRHRHASAKVASAR